MFIKMPYGVEVSSELSDNMAISVYKVSLKHAADDRKEALTAYTKAIKKYIEQKNVYDDFCMRYKRVVSSSELSAEETIEFSNYAQEIMLKLQILLQRAKINSEQALRDFEEADRMMKHVAYCWDKAFPHLTTTVAMSLLKEGTAIG